MLIVPTILAFASFGWECAARLGLRRESAPLERAVWAMTIALATWLGTLWIVALAQALTAPVLIGRTVAIAVIAAAMRLRRPFVGSDARVSRSVAAIVLAIAAWSSFMLWRGSVTPPLSHDALSYHLPKAVFYARAAGFQIIEELDPRPRDLPVNYELLLSEFIVLEGDDELTEWLSTIFYVCFAIAAGALVQRWWPQRSATATALVSVLTAGVPVVLLHSGAHKNDVMTALFIVFGLVTAGRWMTTRERFALLLTIAAFAMAAGTKPQGGIVAIALVPFLAWRWWTMPRRWRELVTALVFAVVAFGLLGGAAYGHTALPKQQHAPAAVEAPSGNVPLAMPVMYGDWSNLWQGPYVLLAAPFSVSDTALRVPWEEARWFWRRYDMYISHAGVPFSVCAVALPFIIWRFRGDPGPRFERIAVTTSCLAATLAMLPVVFWPHGFYAISMPRYLAFLYPVVFAWTVPPLMQGSVRLRRFAAGVAVFAFVAYATDNVMGDDFVPTWFIAYAREHPGTRVIPFDPNRAASIVDRAAGPADRIAIEAAFGAWIQPAFGANLQRPVELIRAGENPPRVPENAEWVIVDRFYDAVWGHPEFRDLSQVGRYVLRGTPPEPHRRLTDALLEDDRFEVVFYNAARKQAVFRRVR